MQPLRHATFRTLVAGALILLLTACAAAPSGPGPASEARAERLLRQGSLVEAARMYEDLAIGNPPPDRDEYALSAARAWLDASRAEDAERALAIASLQLPDARHFERELLRVEISAAQGQYQAAWRQVSQLAEPPRREDAARLFYLRQQVALRAGEPAAAVQAGIARERTAADDAGRNRARRDLLTDLRAAIDRGVRVDPAASRDAQERGWLELAQIASTVGRSPLSANSMVDRWRQRFPGHPASTIVESEILDPAARPEAGGPQLARVSGPVALLLPLSDRSLGPRAALIRDGFQAAAARLADAGLTDVRFYDTAATPVATALRTAAAEGATFVVGPLIKEDVQAALDARPANLPMLALNTVPGGGSAGAWQYALAPEDEARQIARHIAGSGRGNVVVLTPAGDWGQRVAAAFRDELSHAGGRVHAEGTYDLYRGNIESTVSAALGISGSRSRIDRVSNAIGTRVIAEVRPAPEIDAVFVAGFEPLALQQINPLLRYMNVGHLPTYVTSDGIPLERAGIRDLEGMRVLETPWVLDTLGNANDVRLATEHQWRGQGGPRETRLFAFGYDAAMLAAALRRGFVDWPIDGLTGRLTLAPDGRIERQLNWARIRDGAVQPADPLAP